MKRVLAALLWTYAGWYAGAMIASVLGYSAALGPAVGALGLLVVAGDPFRRIWHMAKAGPAVAGAPAPVHNPI